MNKNKIKKSLLLFAFLVIFFIIINILIINKKNDFDLNIAYSDSDFKNTYFEFIDKDVLHISNNKINELYNEAEVDNRKNKYDTIIKVVFDNKVIISSAESMFRDCKELIEVKNFDNLVTKNYKYTFAKCNNLTRIDLEFVDTRYVESTAGMFSSCKVLDNLLLNNWNIKNIKDMSRMFYNCNGLKKIFIDAWNVNIQVNTSEMFDGVERALIPNWYLHRYRYTLNGKNISELYKELELLEHKEYAIENNKERRLPIQNSKIYDVKSKFEREEYIYRDNAIISTYSQISDELMDVKLSCNERINIDENILKDLNTGDVIKLNNVYVFGDYTQLAKNINLVYAGKIKMSEMLIYKFASEDDRTTSVSNNGVRYADKLRFGDIIVDDINKEFMAFIFRFNDNYEVFFVNPYDEGNTHYIIHYDETVYGDNAYTELEAKFIVEPVEYDLIVDKNTVYYEPYFYYNQESDNISSIEDIFGDSYVKKYNFFNVLTKQIETDNIPYNNRIEVSYIKAYDDNKVSDIYFSNPHEIYD